jgi:hypothetical protein
VVSDTGRMPGTVSPTEGSDRRQRPGGRALGVARVGVAARISQLKRGFGLRRTRLRRLGGARTWVGRNLCPVDHRLKPAITSVAGSPLKLALSTMLHRSMLTLGAVRERGQDRCKSSVKPTGQLDHPHISTDP